MRVQPLAEQSRVRFTHVHLPAVNTPQLGWVRARLPRRAQPVPPIVEAEVAADADVSAAGHGSSEIKVGWPPVAAGSADKLVPGLLSRYLARQGIKAQQHDEPAPDDPVDNFFEPVPGDAGGHGRFDRAAHPTSTPMRPRITAAQAAQLLRSKEAS